MNRSPLRAFLLIPLVLACFALVPAMQAVCREGCSGSTTYLGEDALVNNRGGGNTAVGGLALSQNTTGYVNTAVGDVALFGNTTGIANTALGAGALEVNETGFQNTAIGNSALQDNIGSNNTATGYTALFFNTSGNNNTAMGASAMGGNPDIQMTGSNNTATGFFSIMDDTTGSGNTANGAHSLENNTTGSNNTAIGINALLVNTIGSNNIAVGSSAGSNLTRGSSNIEIGNAGLNGESNVIRIGTSGTQTMTFIAGIRETPISGAMVVGITADGQLGVRGSSARFREAIKPMGKASDAILALRPVSFRYQKRLDPKGVPQFGLVAEEVAKVNPDLVLLDEEGKPFSVRYEEVDAMLLNEFLKEHAKVEQLKKDFESKIAEQQKQIAALTSTVQNVSAQVEMSRLAPQTVVDNH